MWSRSCVIIRKLFMTHLAGRSVRRLALVGVVIIFLATVNSPVYADPACVGNVRLPFAPSYCPEQIMDNLPSQGIASITMLAFAPDGSLYFARPATSQIMRLM